MVKKQNKPTKPSTNKNKNTSLDSISSDLSGSSNVLKNIEPIIEVKEIVEPKWQIIEEKITDFPKEIKNKNLCLNMIVKNESRVILRLLESVYKFIDCYCICDTGSTDNTIEIIQGFFDSKGIPGKIIREPFQDFGYNRTFSLKSCEKIDVKYILLMDADMVLQVSPSLSKEKLYKDLTADAYYVFQGSETFFYKNVRIVKNKLGMTYWGVTHEYVKTPDGTNYDKIEKNELFINDIGDGGSKADKFIRDIKLLTRGLEQEPNNDRYTFYLANSYRDAGQLQDAINTYKKRIEIGGWFDEVWHSYYNIGKCYKMMGDMANAVYWWFEAYNFFPDRIENLYEIINHYRCIGKNKLAYGVLLMADHERKKNNNTDFLFLQKDIYDYKLDYELSIIGYYCNYSNYDLLKASLKVLNYPFVEESISQSVLNNYKFYTKEIKSLNMNNIQTISSHSSTPKGLPQASRGFAEFKRNVTPNSSQRLASPKGSGGPRLCTFLQTNTPLRDSIVLQNRKNINILSSIGKTIPEIQNATDFFSSTPSLCLNKNGEMIVNIRYVNYKINDEGGYDNKEKIITKNVIGILDITEEDWVLKKEFLLDYDKDLDNFYVGLEDVRLFTKTGDKNVYYNANRGLNYHNLKVEHGVIQMNTNKTVSGLITMEGQREVEKNWVLFEDANCKMKIIYNWSPLVIGNIFYDNKLNAKGLPDMTFQKTHEIKNPYFFKHLRGSSNGVLIGDEIWFICHTVSYEDRRYYYHLFVVLDSATYEVKKFTPYFTFEKEKVEYSLGFVYFEQTDEILIGYSIMDRETKYEVFKKNIFDEMMITEMELMI